MADTTGALKDLELANSYMDDWYKDKSSDHVLSLAAKYTESARDKDPNVKLRIETKDGVIFYTPDQLAAQILNCQVLLEMHGVYELDSGDARRKILLQVKPMLIKAMKYDPANFGIYEKLAGVYANLGDLHSAVRVTEEAQKAFGDTIEVRKLIDNIGTDKKVIPHQSDPMSGSAMALIGWGMIIGGLILTIFTKAGEGIGFFIFLAGCVVAFLGRQREKNEMWAKAARDSVKK